MKRFSLKYSISLLTLLFILNPIILFAAEDTRSNILLIVADDLGYADTSVFGSKIRTPAINDIANEGFVFTHFNTGTLCAVTRSMLMTGNNNHVSGMGKQSAPPFMRMIPGYETHLSDRVAHMPALLQSAGYHTYMAGKWHLGVEEEYSPLAAGFERSFINTTGASNHFYAGLRSPEPVIYREDGKEVDYPNGRYTTELYTDRLIEFIESGRDDGQPFFAFAAYTSPHWPLQVPDEYLDRYEGQYEQGYDRLRVENFESLKSAGIIPQDSLLPPRNPSVRPWDSLSQEERNRESRKMELYAAMVENLDDNISRLIDYLKAADLYDSTLIVFMSDNGADSTDAYNIGPYVNYLRQNYNNDLDNMGTSSSWVSYGRGWAQAGSAPFNRYKGFLTQGGIAAQLMIKGPQISARNEINHAYLTVMDLAPTFLEIAGAEYPADGSVRPMLGESMLPMLTGATDYVHEDDYVTVQFTIGRGYVREGNWKIVNIDTPFDESKFELFNLESDPGETTNLADQYPERYTRMLELWREKRMEYGIFLPSDL